MPESTENDSPGGVGLSKSTVIVCEPPGVVPPPDGSVLLWVTVKLAVALFPAASRAVTAMRFVPVLRAIALVVQGLVPVAVPLPPRLLAHVTAVTPTLSEAVP